jgi:hypothetical protein
MEKIIKMNNEIYDPLNKTMDLESPFFADLFSFKFGPDLDQFLHWFCKQNGLEIIQIVSQRVDFHSKNGRGWSHSVI